MVTGDDEESSRGMVSLRIFNPASSLTSLQKRTRKAPKKSNKRRFQEMSPRATLQLVPHPEPYEALQQRHQGEIGDEREQTELWKSKYEVRPFIHLLLAE